MSSCIVRLRPASHLHSGRSFEDVERVIARLNAGSGISRVPVEFATDLPFDFEQLEVMASALVQGASSDHVLFIDASFPQDVARGYQIVDAFIFGLLLQRSVLDSECQIVVSMSVRPNPVDGIAELLDIPELSGRLAIVDESGHHLGDTDLARLVERGLEANPIAPDTIDNQLLRHRGVFRSTGGGRPPVYNLFYYDAIGTAIDDFKVRLAEALQEVKPDLVVFDSSTSGAWFSSVVQSACVLVQTSRGQALTAVEVGQWMEHQSGQLLEPENARVARAVKVVERPGSTIAIVAPAYSTGRTITRAIEIVGSPDISRCTAVAVFADQVASLGVARLPATLGVAECQYGGRTLDVHCMHQVELRTIDRGAWLVEAAEVLAEVRDLPLPRIEQGKLDRVALWSLFEDYGVATEGLPARGRPPKRYFPKLDQLGDWDAHWIAECAVTNILDVLPVNRAAILVVLPSEATGSPRISGALERKCGTAVLPIPRPVIDREEPLPAAIREKLYAHRASTIVVFDESTVTHGTLERLIKLVEETAKIPPELVGTVLDLSGKDPEFGLPYFSLAQWAAVAEVEST